MNREYRDVTSRMLRKADCSIATVDGAAPLVIEPRSSKTVGSLTSFLADNSTAIVEDIAKYGAILLRGFAVKSPESLEQAIRSIKGMRGMANYFLPRKGRSVPVENTQFVFHTGLNYEREKTGGTLASPVFHTENYGLPDVPWYVSLFCEVPSTLGGETGLVDMSKVYQDLPETLRSKFADRACLVKLHRLSDISKQFNTSDEAVEEFCTTVALPVITLFNTKFVAIYKPSLIRHPLTQQVSLSVNLAYVPGIQRHVMESFGKDYSGIQWIAHRYFWRSEHRHRVRPNLSLSKRNMDKTMLVAGSYTPVAGARTLTSVMNEDDQKVIAAALRRHCSAFRWRRGDILIFDNLRMAHSGMPGLGSRKMKIMLCNPLHFYTTKDSSGLLLAPRTDGSRECLGSELMRFIAKNAPTGKSMLLAS
jgi:alpha-ketoglutarate-dependent taurine dioxygenase